MAGPQHRTPEHRAAYKRLKRDQAQGKWLECVQGWYGSSGGCLHETRAIAPTDEAHVAHDDSRLNIIGVSHADCNMDDAVHRAHQPRPVTYWIL